MWVFKTKIEKILLSESLIRFCVFVVWWKQFFPSDATIYLSFVLGNAAERANRVILSRNEIKRRLKHVKENRNKFIRATQPENQPGYADFVFDVKHAIQNRIQIKSEPYNEWLTNRKIQHFIDPIASQFKTNRSRHSHFFDSVFKWHLPSQIDCKNVESANCK